MQGGFFVSKVQAFAIIGLFILIIVGVGLMAGLIKAPCPETSPSASTSSPATTPVPKTTTDAGEAGPWQDAFLPAFHVPVHYDMWFNPDFYYDAGTFLGKSSITINITAETKYLIIHYKMMNITLTKVKDAASGEDIKVVRAFAFDRNQYWVTEVDKVLKNGDQVILQLEFDGSLLNGIVGYYKSTYVNVNTNQTSWLATTKFQPTDARKAFPNFDEPKYKATYTITLKHWSNFTALSNMPPKENRTDGIWTETTFEETPLMSSYLVCFIVCDFKYKENTLDNGITHRVWAPPDRVDQVEYAVEAGRKISNYFAQEFGQGFHLPKLDHVAVPDYPSGATEHWGLITYRQARLLYDPTKSSAADKQGVAGIVAHELAHNYFGNLVTNLWWDELWLNEGFASYYGDVAVSVAEPDWSMYFGNLVTCRWWDELWLNEGFARYIQYKAVIEVEPTWIMMDSFVVTTQQSILLTDGTTTSRPVVLPVTHPNEINQAFDGIVYSKGASVLRMMENTFGSEVFKLGIQRYLRDHKFSTAITPDLWAALQEEVGDGVNVTTVMNPWVYQMGYPVIDITALPSGDIKATPKRFLSNPSSNPSEPESPYNYEWYIALTYQTPSAKDRVWMNKTEVTFRDPRSNANEWIKMNPMQTGYYRVNYEEKLWDLLANQLRSDHTVFTAVDRANLLDDAFALAVSTQLSYTVGLNMTKYLEKEVSYFPWRSMSSALTSIGGILYGHENYDLWRKYIRDLTSHAMDTLGVEDDGEHLEKLLRTRIMGLSCFHGYPGCLANTTALFQAWIQDPVANAIPANIRGAVYEYGMRNSGTEVEWNIMWERFSKDPGGQEGYAILYALAQSRQLWLVQKYLEYCLDENKLRTQDFFTAVNYAAANPTASYYVWSWVRANYDALIERFGVQDRYFGRMVPNIVSQFKSYFHLDEVMSFYEKYSDAGAGVTPRIQSLETIRGRIEWRERNEEKVVSWLKDNVSL